MSSLDDFLGGADKPERIRTSIYINRDDFLALEQRALNAKRLKKGELIEKSIPTNPRNRLAAIVKHGAKQLSEFDSQHNNFHFFVELFNRL